MQKDAAFVYDPASHTYTLEGKRIIGLTESLHLNGLYRYLDNVKDDVAEWARERGQGVHLATHYHDKGTLDLTSVHAEVEPYLEAWKDFLKINPFKMVALEKPIYSKRWRFGCTPDRVVECGLGQYGVLEIKASEYKSPTYAFQTVGQAVAASEFYDLNVRRRFVIRLLGSGKYKLEEYRQTEYNQDRDMFFCLLRVAQMKKERGL